MYRLNKIESSNFVSLMCSLLPDDLHSELILYSNLQATKKKNQVYFHLCESLFAANFSTQTRLVGGTVPLQGLVEIRLFNHWGTICDDGFGPAEATVICRMMGYNKLVYINFRALDNREYLVMIRDNFC